MSDESPQQDSPQQVVLKTFEVWMKKDMEAYKKLIAPDYVVTSTYPAHLPISGEGHGPDGAVEYQTRIAAPFELLGAEVKDLIASGDTVVLSAEEKLRVKATGKEVLNRVVAIIKVRDGQLASTRLFGDTYAFHAAFQQDEAPKRTSRPKKNAVKNALKAATTGKARASKSAGKNKVKPAAKKTKAGARKSTARARR
ncbi:nuclear transport factor 2 family protein [Hyalangium minutum]|uniref:Cytochrome c4 n=1 Tax=Hyalangium minutum TaxID=394096 RepID=A0A085WRM9_9BACT|nr:nuclear transport factor 2 family protein [Hyalangium minutum]KFE70342.1 Cytochrome c4 [Hyalangium minutum]